MSNTDKDRTELLALNHRCNNLTTIMGMELVKLSPDYEHAYDLADQLRNHIGHARLIAAGIARAGGAAQ